MKGCRPLTDPEIAAVLEQLAKTLNPARDRCLFYLGVNTGFRISELLSLRLGDVWQNGKLAEEIAVARRYMKKKTEGRSVPLYNEAARAALDLWVKELLAEKRGPETFLFISREGENRHIDRRTAWRGLKNAFAAAGLAGKLATHTMRKTFARKMREIFGDDLQALQQAMGHVEITSTMRYIASDNKKVIDAFRKL